MTGAGALLPKQLCPYIFCDVEISVIPTQRRSDDPGMVLVVEDHPIGHPILTGPCVMSGMQLPLSLGARWHVSDRERVDSRTIHLAIRDEARRNDVAKTEAARQGRGPWSPPPALPVSQEVGGRPTDPPPTADEWALGGRQDEDVVAEPVAHENEPHIGGTTLGRAGQVATLQEIIGMVSGANENIGSAMGVLNDMDDRLSNAIGAVEQAAQLIGATIDGSASNQLTDSYARLNAAESFVRSMHDTIVNAQSALASAEEHNNRFIGNALS